MEGTNQSNPPTGWRAKMEYAVKVNSSITFQGSKGNGARSAAWSYSPSSAGALNLTKDKFTPLLKNVPH
tara:strand:- start:5884 stop:6090 length:207 start_codon:yes stop_codon:yes gene_type:complete